MSHSQERPLITFALFAYNQERFIREAVEGAFSQTYEPLEVILSDDCSVDRTFEIMKEMAASYKGPHNIILNRNEKNLGIGGHVNRMMEISNGELIVCAAGDDISRAERTERSYAAWLSSNKSAFSIKSDYLLVNEQKEFIRIIQNGGELGNDPLTRIIRTGSTEVHGCAHVYHRSIFEVFGPIDARIVYEDQAIPFRALLLGSIGEVKDILVYQRLHSNNTSEYGYIPKNKSDWMNKLRIRHVNALAVREQYLSDLRRAELEGLVEETIVIQLISEVETYIQILKFRWELFCEPGWRNAIKVLKYPRLAIKAGPRVIGVSVAPSLYYVLRNCILSTVKHIKTMGKFLTTGRLAN